MLAKHVCPVPYNEVRRRMLGAIACLRATGKCPLASQGYKRQVSSRQQSGRSKIQ
jgi:hypothetical protein